MDCTRNEAGGVENVLIGGENISLEKDVKKTCEEKNEYKVSSRIFDFTKKYVSASLLA